MWGPFANVFGAMAAAARGGAPADGGAGGAAPVGPVPGGAPFFGNGAPMMMPFFHPAMGMAAGGFAWPPAGPGLGAPAPARAEETSKPTNEPQPQPEPNQGKQTWEEPAPTPPA